MKRVLLTIHEHECEAAGKDTGKITQLALDLHRISVRMKQLGVYVFGGSGSGTIRAQMPGDDRPLVLADIGSGFDGGDGATREDADGLLRGE
jgi:hypothetical protein